LSLAAPDLDAATEMTAAVSGITNTDVCGLIADAAHQEPVVVRISALPPMRQCNVTIEHRQSPSAEAR